MKFISVLIVILVLFGCESTSPFSVKSTEQNSVYRDSGNWNLKLNDFPYLEIQNYFKGNEVKIFELGTFNFQDTTDIDGQFSIFIEGIENPKNLKLISNIEKSNFTIKILNKTFVETFEKNQKLNKNVDYFKRAIVFKNHDGFGVFLYLTDKNLYDDLKEIKTSLLNIDLNKNARYFGDTNASGARLPPPR